MVDTGANEANFQDDFIPLMIKSYEGGKMTQKICKEGYNGKLSISSPRGQGLKLNQLPPGKLIFVAGGTGFYPFMDAVDLLYKVNMIESDGDSDISKTILRLNPVCNEANRKFLSKFQFLFFVAINEK